MTLSIELRHIYNRFILRGNKLCVFLYHYERKCFIIYMTNGLTRHLRQEKKLKQLVRGIIGHN